MIDRAETMIGEWKLNMTDQRLRIHCHQLGERVYLMKDRIIITCNFLRCENAIVFRYKDMIK